MKLTRVFARPQKAETKAKAQYFCCACGHHGQRKTSCKFCGSEDVFDKTRPEWPCSSCREYTAKFESTCEECAQRSFNALIPVLLTSLFDELFGINIRDEGEITDNPREDYGDGQHREFGGWFPKDVHRFGEQR